LLLGFRSWEFGAFTAMRREASVSEGDHQKGPRKR
jgi:hypothetical protein